MAAGRAINAQPQAPAHLAATRPARLFRFKFVQQRLAWSERLTARIIRGLVGWREHTDERSRFQLPYRAVGHTDGRTARIRGQRPDPVPAEQPAIPAGSLDGDLAGLGCDQLPG